MVPEGFDDEVLEIVRQIPRGRVVTYGQIARLMGRQGLARRVGRALAAAPAEVPCHRVVNARGATVPGWPEQRTLLERESVPFLTDGRVDMRRAGWEALREEL